MEGEWKVSEKAIGTSVEAAAEEKLAMVRGSSEGHQRAIRGSFGVYTSRHAWPPCTAGDGSHSIEGKL